MDRLSTRSLVIPVLILGVAACSKNTNRNEFPTDTARGAVAPTVSPTTTDTAARRDTSMVPDTMARRDTSVTPVTTPTPSPAAGAQVTLKVSGGPDGYLTDDKGRAVYFIALFIAFIGVFRLFRGFEAVQVPLGLPIFQVALLLPVWADGTFLLVLSLILVNLLVLLALRRVEIAR